MILNLMTGHLILNGGYIRSPKLKMVDGIIFANEEKIFPLEKNHEDKDENDSMFSIINPNKLLEEWLEIISSYVASECSAQNISLNTDPTTDAPFGSLSDHSPVVVNSIYQNIIKDIELFFIKKNIPVTIDESSNFFIHVSNTMICLFENPVKFCLPEDNHEIPEFNIETYFNSCNDDIQRESLLIFDGVFFRTIEPSEAGGIIETINIILKLDYTEEEKIKRIQGLLTIPHFVAKNIVSNFRLVD